MSKMSEMSFSFSMNVMLSISKMSKKDQIHLRAVMLCMSKMLKMGKEHTHTFLYRVCDMSKVSEMSFSFSLNVMLSMSKMPKKGQIHLGIVMLCVSKTLKMQKEHTHMSHFSYACKTEQQNGISNLISKLLHTLDSSLMDRLFHVTEWTFLNSLIMQTC